METNLNKQCKLNEIDVLRIRQLMSDNILPVTKIARMFGVTRHTIYNVVNNVTHSYVNIK